MQEIKELHALADFSGGLKPDDGEYVELPAWYRLENLWFNEGGKLLGRPHFKPYNILNSVVGLGLSHKKELIVVGDGLLNIGGTNYNAITGSAYLSYDYSLDRTIVTVGDKPLVYDGTTANVINLSNVYALATMQGASKARLVAVTTDDRKKLWVSTPFDLDDFGQIFLTDLQGIANDKKPTAGRIWGLSHDVIDLMEIGGEVIIITKQGFYKLVPNVDEDGFNPVLVKETEIDIWNVKPKKLSGGIIFLNAEGPHIYPSLDRIPMPGLNETIKGKLNEANARINIDRLRRLIILTPDISIPESFVYIVDVKRWVKWNIAISDMQTANNKTYAIIGTGLYEMVDSSFAGLIPYEIIIQSGLSGYGSNVTRKRFITLGIELETELDVDAYMDIKIEDIANGSTIFTQYSSGIRRIESYIGSHGTRGSMIMKFKNYGSFKLHNIYLKFAEKLTRMPKSVLPL